MAGSSQVVKQEGQVVSGRASEQRQQEMELLELLVTQLPYLDDASWNITSAPLTLHPLATTTAFGLGGSNGGFAFFIDMVLSSPVLSRPVLSRPSINPVLSRSSFSPPAHPPAWWRHRIPGLHTSSGTSRTVLSPRMTSACVWRWAPTTRWAAISFP